jgi:hypothetical protein
MLIGGKSADQNILYVLHSLRRIQREGDGSDSVAVFSTGPEQHYYIQVLGRRREKKVFVDSVSNHYLKLEFALNSEQISRLLALGWNQPDGTKRPNFWRWMDARTDIDLQVIARLVMQTFVQVYGFRLDRSLEIELHLSTGYR